MIRKPGNLLKAEVCRFREEQGSSVDSGQVACTLSGDRRYFLRRDMMGKVKRRIISLLLAAVLLLAGCGGGGKTEQTPAPAAPTAAPAEEARTALPEGVPDIPGLAYERSMEKKYAVQFDVHYYEGGYKYLAIGDGNNYLIVPEGGQVPQGLDAEVKILQQPLDRIYLAGSSSMALFDAMNALDTVILSSLKQSDWYVENAAAAMERGDILFGGKYSEPDYELLIDSDINIAIENTMILHSPKVIEMIENLGIPVFIDYSSYEPHPLGRTEWVKLFAAIINREEDAEAFFNAKIALMGGMETFPAEGKTVAVFLIDSAGKAQVRSADDYLTRIITIAGGEYPFSGAAVENSGRANVSMTMEEFYASAMDVDYLIYNASGYSADVDSLAKLLEKSGLLADFKAFREGNVWWIGGETYQHSDLISDLIFDVHLMLTGEDGEMTFLHPME